MTDRYFGGSRKLRILGQMCNRPDPRMSGDIGSTSYTEPASVAPDLAIMADMGPPSDSDYC